MSVSERTRAMYVPGVDLGDAAKSLVASGLVAQRRVMVLEMRDGGGSIPVHCCTVSFYVHSLFGTYHLPNFLQAYISLQAPEGVFNKGFTSVPLPIYYAWYFAVDFGQDA